MPLEFFAPGIFIEEGPWRARQARARDARCCDDPTLEAVPDNPGVGLLVPDQPVMLVVRNRRDGPWGHPFWS